MFWNLVFDFEVIIVKVLAALSFPLLLAACLEPGEYVPPIGQHERDDRASQPSRPQPGHSPAVVGDLQRAP